ncbi:MAG: hypothetical protein PVH29_04965 [Candidatus Zixiibacteriota bacterium]|jgi:hypothetical protein
MGPTAERLPSPTPRWRRIAGNFYAQLVAAYGIVAVATYLRAFPFRSHYEGRIWLTPLHAYWDPRITPWLAVAAVALAAAVALTLWSVRAGKVWPLWLSAAVGIAAVNAAPGGGRKFPFDWLERAVFDARILFQAPNVFADYAEITRTVSCHCRVRPGGLYWFLGTCDRLFGGNTYLLEVLIVLIAAASVPLVYRMTRALASREESIVAAALFACAPSLLIFGSGPDGLYCFLAAGVFSLGLRAASSARPWPWALGAGAVLAAALTSSFALTVLAVFLAGFAAAAALSGRGWGRSAAAWALVILTAGVALLLFQIVTGYDHLGVFARAYRAAQDLPSGGDNLFKMAGRALGLSGVSVPIPGSRPYGVFVVGNLYAFLLTMGVPAAVLYTREVFRVLAGRDTRRSFYGLSVIISLVVFLAYNFSGLLLGEVERVWLFLVPVFLIPAGVQLFRIARGPGGRKVLTIAVSLAAAQAFIYNALMLTGF